MEGGLAVVDLNLIRVFAAVVEEGSVTAAADRLKMSQPSVTQALNRLRRATGDQLFERAGRGISPTRAALQLYEEVGRLPSMADSAVNALGRFDPMTARATFRIALTDLGQTVFLPDLVSGLAESAPHSSLDVVNLNTTTAVEDLVAGWLDLAVSSTPLRGALRPAVIRTDHYCCVSRKGRFGDRNPSLEDMTSLPRVVVRDSTGHTLVESLLPPPAEGSLHLSGFSAIPGVLAVSGLIAFVPQAVTVDWAARWDLEVRSLPPEEFASTVRAHAAIDAPTAATSWFIDWAVETMRAAR